jgi:hypothetical protein
VRYSDLTKKQRRAVIRSSMFLKDKFLASGQFDKYKARHVAGGDQQDKLMYENLSSPTAHISSVFAIAAIAAFEGRIVDRRGVFECVHEADWCVGAHTPQPSDEDPAEDGRVLPAFRQPRRRWWLSWTRRSTGVSRQPRCGISQDLSSKLRANGFIENPFDRCIFSKEGSDGHQISIVLHVDDLMVTSVSQKSLDEFGDYLKFVYPETRTNRGQQIAYLGMSFEFSVEGEARVTMDHCTTDILSGCGVSTARATPAASTLFDVRDDAPAASEHEKVWFHTHVAKMLHLTKRVRPECLTAVAFLMRSGYPHPATIGCHIRREACCG